MMHLALVQQETLVTIEINAERDGKNMIKFGKGIVRCRIPILILSLLLLVPSVIGYLGTRINYDILSYLPDDIETMKGQDILLEQFGTGAFSVAVVEGMDNKGAAALKKEMEQLDHVKSVLWYDTLADLSLPMEILPDEDRKSVV